MVAINPHKVPFVGKFAQSMRSLRREDERGLLYRMEYDADYYTLLPVMDLVANAGCSTFVAKTPDGGVKMGRNFDLRHYRNNIETSCADMTGLIVAVHTANPRAKYASVGIADAFWLDAKHGSFYEGVPEDGKTDISMALLLPFICMDGVNERGLAVSIMHLPTENRWDETAYVDPATLDEKQARALQLLEKSGETPDPLWYRAKSGSYAINTADRRAWTAYKNFAVWQKERGKKTMIHTVLMREMLDFCANVDEAVALAASVNVKSPARDNDYHVLVADASGRALILEWIDGVLKWRDCPHATNFALCRADRYGYGYDRDAILRDALRAHPNGMTGQEIMATLADAAQDCRGGAPVGFTQWSAVYDLTHPGVKLCVHLDFSKEYEYTV